MQINCLVRMDVQQLAETILATGESISHLA